MKFQILKYIGIGLLGAICSVLPEITSDALAKNRAIRYKAETGYSDEDEIAEIEGKEEE